MLVTPGLPIASHSNLLASSKMVVMGLASSATAIQNARTTNFIHGTTGDGLPGVNGMVFGSDGIYRRQLSALGATSTDGNGFPAAGVMGYAPATTTYRRIELADVSHMAAQSTGASLSVATPGEWTEVSNPAAGVQATVTKAAGGATARHVCRSITASIYNSAGAAGAQVVNLRDGASGAGTVKWLCLLGTGVAQQSAEVTISGLSIVGSLNTAMTIEFVAAPGAGTTQQTVGMSGNTV